MWVYILKCDDRIFYTGITNNFKRRFYEHLSRKKGYTSKFKKKVPVFIYEVESRKKARELEIEIKRRGAKRFLISQLKSLRQDINTKLIVKKEIY